MIRSTALVLVVAACLAAAPINAGVAADLWDWYLLPAVASAPGQLGTYFRTDVTLVNPYVYPVVSVRIWLLKNDQDNRNAPYVTVTLRAGETVVLRDIVATSFGFTGGASLILSSTNGLAFGCTARTYTGTTGTYGFAGNGHYYRYWGTAEAFTSGLRNGNGYRTNLGLVSTSSSPLTVEVNVYGSTGRLGARRITLPPFGRTQFSVAEIAPDFDNAYAVWTGVTTGSEATWVPFATVIDNASGDSVYIDDVYDRAYSTYEARYDLSGEWRGTAAWPSGSQNLTALVYQYGPRLEAWIYNSNSGARLTYLVGYEHRGTIYGSGTGSLYGCLGDAVSGSGSVVSNGTGLSLTMQGAGCFASAAAVAFQKYRSFSAPATSEPEAAKGMPRPDMVPHETPDGSPIPNPSQ